MPRFALGWMGLLVLALASAGSGFAGEEALPRPSQARCFTPELTEHYRDVIQAAFALPEAERTPVSRPKAVPIGGWNDFFSMDVATRQPIQVRAQLRGIGKHCYIYVQEGFEHTQATVDALAKEFDQKIYPTNHEHFGKERSPGVDFDPRITLLLMDIVDGWKPGQGYVAGYFFPLDGVSTRLFPFSNEREMFYLDIRPGDPTRDDYLGILAHEFQHMIHHNADRKEAVWLNEAMAQIAFFVNDYGHAPQISHFLANSDTALPEFDNGLDDYGSVYLWTYYVLKRFGPLHPEGFAGLTRALVQNPLHSVESFDSVLAELGQPDAATVFRDWALANAINDPSLDQGQYGYDSSLPIHVEPQSVQPLGTTGTVSGEVFPWASETVVFQPGGLPSSQGDRAFSSEMDLAIWASRAPARFQLEVEAKGVEATAVIRRGGKNFLSSVGPGGLEVQDLGGVESITLVLTGVPAKKTKKGRDYTVRFTAKGSPDVETRLETAGRLEALARRTEAAGRGAEAGEIRRARDQVEVEVAQELFHDAGRGALEVVGEAVRSQASAPALGSLRRVLRRARYLALDQALLEGFEPSASLEPGPRGDDQDDAHENVGYLLSKAGEVVHSLDHLKIDPKLLEGEILKLWRMLEIARGFPHLPIPDGLNVVDYPMDPIRGLMAGWAQRFEVDYDTGVDPISSVDGTKADVQATLKRLRLAAEIVEFTYNNSMQMADDVTASVYEFVRLVFHAFKASRDISRIFERIPLVGSGVRAIRRIVHRKLVRILEVCLVMLSSKLKAPYSTYAPMVISLASWAYNKFMQLPKDPSDPRLGSLQAMGVKILGRYALSATPKIGFVRRGEGQIQAMTEYASQLTHEGTLEEARQKVWDDGLSGTPGAVREQLEEELVDRHKTFTRNMKIVDVTKRILSISQYASVLDPTQISKIVAVVAGATTTGLLAQSAYRAGSLYVRMQRDFSERGVRLAFDPGLSDLEEAENLARTAVEGTALEETLLSIQESYGSYERSLARARVLARGRAERLAQKQEDAALDEALASAWRELELRDRALEESLSELLSLGFQAEGVTRLSEESLVALASAEALARAEAAADVLALGLGHEDRASSSKDSRRLQLVQDVYGALALAAQKTRVQGSEAQVVVTKSSIRKRGELLEVQAELRNSSSKDLSMIQVSLQSGLHFEVENGAVQTLDRLRAGKKAKVRFRIHPLEDFGMLPLVSIVPEAAGAKGIAKLQVLSID